MVQQSSTVFMFKETDMTDESPQDLICSWESDSCSCSLRAKFGLTFNHSCWLFIKNIRGMKWDLLL